MDGWIGWKSPGGGMYRAPYGANNTSKTDVAPWCYKWVDWMDGLDGNLRVGVCIEHLTVLIKKLVHNLGGEVDRAMNLESKVVCFPYRSFA